MNDFPSCLTFCCQNWPFPAESLVKGPYTFVEWLWQIKEINQCGP